MVGFGGHWRDKDKNKSHCLSIFIFFEVIHYIRLGKSCPSLLSLSLFPGSWIHTAFIN